MKDHSTAGNATTLGVTARLGIGQTTSHSPWATWTTGHEAHQHRKLVMDQNVAFVVWLGIPVLTLVWAQVSLWHRRRVLG